MSEGDLLQHIPLGLSIGFTTRCSAAFEPGVTPCSRDHPLSNILYIAIENPLLPLEHNLRGSFSEFLMSLRD